MTLLIDFLLFILASIFSFYIPGTVFLRLFKVQTDFIVHFVLSWFVGISLFLVGTYLFAWMGILPLYLLIILILSILYFKNYMYKGIWKNLTRKIDYYTLGIIVTGSVAMSCIMFFSGWMSREGIQFYGVNATDGIRHLAYIKNMMHFFPPQHPGLADISLRGFHYFYDFMLAQFASWYRFSVEDLYFRFFPFLISMLYGAGFWYLARSVTLDKIQQRFILLFAFFGESFSWILFFLYPEFGLKGAIVQPLGLMVNPFTILAMGIFAVGITCISKIKDSWKYALIAGLLLGILSQMKVYIGIVGILCVIMYAALLVILYKKKYFLSSLILVAVTGVLTAITYLPNNFGAGGLVFAPLLYYSHYMQTKAFDPLHWEIKRQVFAQANNILRIMILYIEAVVIFWLFNLGLRIIAIFQIRTLLKKEFWKKDINVLLMLAILVLVLLGSFFVQTSSMFDTVQFFWLSLVLLSVPAGIAWGKISSKSLWIGIFVFLILSFPGVISYISGYIPQRQVSTISRQDLDVYSSAHFSTDPDKFIVLVPEVSTESGRAELSFLPIPLVSAMTGRAVYMEGGEIPNKLEHIQKMRKENIMHLHTDLTQCNVSEVVKNMQNIGSKVLMTFQKVPCLATSSAVIRHYQGESVTMYIFK